MVIIQKDSTPHVDAASHLKAASQVQDRLCKYFPCTFHGVLTLLPQPDFEFPFMKANLEPQGDQRHKILETIWEIPFLPRFIAITSLIMNCSSVLQEMEVIATAGSNHFVQLPQLSVPFTMIGI
jgi:hypothetical protein